MSRKEQVILRNNVFFEPLKMVLDDIAYNFNIQKGVWEMSVLNKANKIIPDQISKNSPIINNDDLESRVKAIHNKELDDFKLKIETTRLQIETLTKKIENSKETQKQLTENYIRETLEVEKIKEAREKLDRLKKELGAL